MSKSCSIAHGMNRMFCNLQKPDPFDKVQEKIILREAAMQVGMIGLGRMGMNMALRLIKGAIP